MKYASSSFGQKDMFNFKDTGVIVVCVNVVVPDVLNAPHPPAWKGAVTSRIGTFIADLIPARTSISPIVLAPRMDLVTMSALFSSV